LHGLLEIFLGWQRRSHWRKKNGWCKETNGSVNRMPY